MLSWKLSTQNGVIHTENCKLELSLDCSTTQMERNIRGMCGIQESSRRRGFADFAVEVFYIDFDSLELLKKSLSSIKANIQDLSLFPGYKMRLNMESLLTLHVENQHAVTHFKRETFTLYEYAVMFGTSVEEAVKRVSKWAAAYYTHPNSRILQSANITYSFLTSHQNSKANLTGDNRNEKAEMRAWAKMHGKSVRQRNVRRDNTMDRAGTLPLNLYETETVLKPVNLSSLKAAERVPSESDEPPNSNEDVSLPPKSPNNEQVDSFSASDSDSNSKEEVDSALETTLRMIRPTRLGRKRTLTSRMTDFLRVGMTGM